MKLTEVQARIIQYKGYGIYHYWDGPIKYGHGLEFECPRCLQKSLPMNGHPPTHARHKIVCWSVGVPPRLPPLGRWMFYGTSINDLSIDAPLPSIRISKPCESEYLVRDGELLILG